MTIGFEPGQLTRLLAERARMEAAADYLLSVIQEHFPLIERIAVALHESESDVLRSYVDTRRAPGGGLFVDGPIAGTALNRVRDGRTPRVIENLLAYEHAQSPHTQRLIDAGYRSSYTVPIIDSEAFFGFVFFDSAAPGQFPPGVTARLNPIAQLLAVLMTAERRGALASASSGWLGLRRRATVPQGGFHLVRMAHYCRLIGRGVARMYDLDDRFIECLYRFSPIHDIGKITIPDSVLLKQAPLAAPEFVIMRKHVERGVDIIDRVFAGAPLLPAAEAVMLRNLVGAHHEFIDGSGYPNGLPGESIPLEARILATADIFDALTSTRPYKPAWSNERALEDLQRLAGRKLDPLCVSALSDQRKEIARIQASCEEDLYG